MVLVAAACIGRDEVGPATTLPPGGSEVAPSVAPSASAPATSSSPTAASTAPSVAPSGSPIPASSADPTATPAGTSGPATVCTGNRDNREFFAGAAAGVDWAVYCLVAEGRWFVMAGNYQRARGGWLVISYTGPGGARIDLSEGNFCQESNGCVPTGADAGEAAFGDQVGAFIAGDDGSHTIVVDRGKDVSWVATGTDIDEAAFRSIVAGLNRVAP